MKVLGEVERGLLRSPAYQNVHSHPSMCLHQVSKAARQEKRFQDYNERCTFHHQARVSHGRWVARQRAA